MKKHTKIISALFGFVFAALLPLSGIKFSPEVAKADGLNYLGTVSIEEVKVYNAFGNANEFLMLKLSGSDFPEEPTKSKEVAKTTMTERGFTVDLPSTVSFINSSGNKVNVTDYNSVYSCQHRWGSYFSMWMLGMGTSKAAYLKSGFKIPSHSLIMNETTSPTYGYYTLDKDYELYADDINYAMGKEKFYDWHFAEYNPRDALISQTMSYVDNGHEMLTFQLLGLGLDYPTASGQGNYQFDISTAPTLLSNFKDKIELYDADKNPIEYDFDYEFVIGINMWQVSPRFSVGLTNLANAKYLKIKEGLLLPSYAKYQNNTTSPVYDGYIIGNDFYLEIDPDGVHETGHIINWLTTRNILKNVTLSAFKTQRPFDNYSEFYEFHFNESTDFLGVEKQHWSPLTLMPNVENYIDLYDSSDNALSLNIAETELLFNYGGSNNITVCYTEANTVAKIVLKEGLLFPSYALYSGLKDDPNYGYYQLGYTYTLHISPENTRQKGVEYEWNLPKATIEYYDENDQIISSLLDEAVYGSTYELAQPIPKEGYFASWEVIQPSSLVVDNNRITVPLTGETIKFKAKYEIIPLCEVTYYNEKDQIIASYTQIAKCGFYYYLEPVISKKGHDASWVVVEPQGLTIEDNRVFIPEDVETLKLKLNYTPRTYTLTFGGIMPPVYRYVTYGEAIGDLPSIPEVAGKTGLWVIDETVLTPETVYNWDDNMTAEMEYVDRMCVLTFETMGGTEVENIEVLYGTTLSKLPVTTKVGYYFDKWALDPAGTNELTVNTVIEQDYTVYAFWLNECVVTFDTDGGSLIEAVSMGEGSILEQPIDPTKEGFKFLYWALDGQKYEFGKAITESITLKAVWEKLPTEDDVDPNNNTGKTILTIALVASSVVLAAGIGLMLFFLLKKKKV